MLLLGFGGRDGWWWAASAANVAEHREESEDGVGFGFLGRWMFGAHPCHVRYTEKSKMSGGLYCCLDVREDPVRI